MSDSTSSPVASDTPSISSATSSSSSAPTSEPQDVASEGPAAGEEGITVSRSGIGTAADGDFTTWGVVLKNTGVDVGMVDVTVTGLDKSGDAISTDSASLFRVPTGESFVGGLFLEKGVKKIEVDISGDTPYEENDAPIAGGLAAKLTISGRSFDAIVNVKVTSTLDVATKDGMPFYIVYFDAAGKVVGGANGFTPGSFQPGKARQIALQNSMSGPPADHFAAAKISFDVSEAYLKAS